MPERAQVTSIQEIEAFRSALILYLSKARPVLEEISGEVVRTRLWLQVDRSRYWKGALRERKIELERTEAELFTARMSHFQNVTAAHRMAVRRARAAVTEAEEKLGLLKKWDRDLQSHTDPLVKQIEALHSFLAMDLAQAIPYLARVVTALENYAAIPALDAARKPPGGQDNSGNDNGEGEAG